MHSTLRNKVIWDLNLITQLPRFSSAYKHPASTFAFFGSPLRHSHFVYTADNSTMKFTTSLVIVAAAAASAKPIENKECAKIYQVCLETITV